MYFPANLNIEDKKCVVVGAGKVAERKIRRLLECNARVVAISPKATPLLKALAAKKKIICRQRQVAVADLKGACLVISATEDRRVNALVSSYCRRNNILVNVVDSPKECSVILPSIVKRGSLTIAISTDGISPAFAKHIRLELEQKYGVEYAAFLRMMKKIRPRVLSAIKSPAKRKALFQQLIDAGIITLIKEGKGHLARQRFSAILKNAHR